MAYRPHSELPQLTTGLVSCLQFVDPCPPCGTPNEKISGGHSLQVKKENTNHAMKANERTAIVHPDVVLVPYR